MDGHGNAFLKANVDSGSNPIIHLGLDVYAEMPVEEAEKILIEREHVYVREIQGLEKELEDRMDESNKVQEILYALQQQAQVQMQAQTPQSSNTT